MKLQFWRGIQKTICIFTIAITLSFYACHKRIPPPDSDIALLNEKLIETSHQLAKIRQALADLKHQTQKQQETLDAMNDKSAPISNEKTSHSPNSSILDVKNITVPPPPDIITVPDFKATLAPQKKPPPISKKVFPPAKVLYKQGHTAFKKRDYKKAIATFQSITNAYPKHSLADNAFYWMGECLYSQKNFTGAIKLFDKVITLYPKANKVPDALLKTGFAHIAMGDKKTARKFLSRVIKNYPFTETALIAEKSLKKLNR